jgi:CspA family cold shock protein
MMHQTELKGPRGGQLIDNPAECRGDCELAGAIELAGVIKWFDVSKGYGFIVPDNGMSDVFLHGTCLHRNGFPVACKGTRVAVEAVPGPRGLHACRILSLDPSTAVQPEEMPCARPVVTATGGPERVRVKWINRLRGFGFLSREDGMPDIFVHVQTLRRCGLAELRPGQLVVVRFGHGPKGLMATEVRADAASGGPARH